VLPVSARERAASLAAQYNAPLYLFPAAALGFPAAAAAAAGRRLSPVAFSRGGAAPAGSPPPTAAEAAAAAMAVQLAGQMAARAVVMVDVADPAAAARLSRVFQVRTRDRTSSYL
jgi:hypothetical protein